MKNTRRFSIALSILCVATAMLACDVFPTPRPPEGVSMESEPLEGNGTGKLDTHYYKIWINDQETTPVCTDDKAEFHMTVGPTSTIPEDTQLKNGVPNGYSYLRLEVYAAEYFLNDGVCDYSGDRSNSVVHFVLEGGYNTATGNYVILSCGKNLTLLESDFSSYPEAQVDGYVTCGVSDQIQLVFTLNRLQLYIK
jgi:hypothetical protein